MTDGHQVGRVRDYQVIMRRTRRSGNTAGEALLLQLHIAGPQKGVGSFSGRRALAAYAGRSHRPSIPPPCGRPFNACEQEMPPGRQDAEEAAETQEAEAAEEARRVEDTRSSTSCA
jgi:hypothetical protein